MAGESTVSLTCIPMTINKNIPVTSATTWKQKKCYFIKPIQIGKTPVLILIEVLPLGSLEPGPFEVNILGPGKIEPIP